MWLRLRSQLKNLLLPRVVNLQPHTAIMGKRGGQRKPRSRNTGDVTVKENPLFEKYYKALGIVPEAEWPLFMEKLRLTLPSTFRITGTKGSALEVLRTFEETYFKQLENIEFADGTMIEPPKPLPWYPDRLAWTLNTSRQFIRKHAGLRHLHDALVLQSEQGNISRQEAVSMIPPLLLDVQPQHAVLDMCAAPGSKTSQIIEAMHSNNDAVPGGVVVANDMDHKRCYMLVHQSKRLQSPSFMVMNQDASLFPTMFQEHPADPTNPNGLKLKFDRVLCDVPCSGDGTLRKNPGIWNKWNPYDGTGLHPLQVRILQRGLNLLKDDGLLVYSTCSFNPLENEAVVAEAIRRSKGTLELVDVRDKLPGLIRSDGISSWVLMDRAGNFYNKNDEVKDPNISHKFVESMNPPTEEEVAAFHLDRCLRLVPHSQDTGGFFVAVLRKVIKDPVPAPLPKAAAKPAEATDESQAAAPVAEAPVTKKKSRRIYNEEPYILMYKGEHHKPLVELLSDFYGLAPEFPWKLMMARGSGERQRNLYVISELSRQILERNEDRDIKIINMGVKVFTRTDSTSNTCAYRLCQSGIDVLLPYMTKRVLKASPADVFKILREDAPHFEDLAPELCEGLLALDDGAVALVCDEGLPSLSGQPLKCPVHICAWRGRKTLRCLVTKQERLHYELLLGQDVEDVHATHSRKKDKKKGSDARDARAGDARDGGARGGARDGAVATEEGTAVEGQPPAKQAKAEGEVEQAVQDGNKPVVGQQSMDTQEEVVKAEPEKQ
eukprot:m.128322 g.128322  ORF g.128322 m.128322 type:complete len:774 (-) comp15824_c0_seq8:34-2355(-)